MLPRLTTPPPPPPPVAPPPAVLPIGRLGWSATGAGLLQVPPSPHPPPQLLPALQSMHGNARQRALATSKAQRPVGMRALARIGTPGHLAITFSRK